MDPLRTSATNSSPVGPSNAPAKTSAVPSLLDRVKAVVNKALDKMDEIYDKAGFAGRIAYYVALAIAVTTSTIFIGPVVGSVIAVAGLIFDWSMEYRNKIYTDKKNEEKRQLLEQELSTINQKVEAAKFDELLGKCTNKEELQAAMKNISNQLDEIKEEVNALALKIPNKYFVKDLLEVFNRDYKYIKILSEYDFNDLQQQKKLLSDHLEILTTNLKKQFAHLRKAFT